MDANSTLSQMLANEGSLTGKGVVLVGLANGRPFLQTLLGTLTTEYRTDQLVVMGDRIRDAENPIGGTWERHPVVDLRMTEGRESFEVPSWCNGHGFRIFRSEGVWRFSTGLRAYDSGSSGPLLFGEYHILAYLTEALKRNPNCFTHS